MASGRASKLPVLEREGQALRRAVHGLGAVVLAAQIALALMSYLQAPVLWSGPDYPQADAFFAALGSRAVAVTADPATWLSLAQAFSSRTAVLASRAVPLAAACLAVLVLLTVLSRRAAAADAALARLLMRWSLAFAAAAVFAYPLYTQDMWLSAAWGRMLAAGVNPYQYYFTPESVAGLPLDHFGMIMSYGPLWALLAGAVMAVAGKSVLASAVLFKALLAAAWLGSLVLVDRIAARRGGLDRCMALILFGWTPLSVIETLGEGHNDVVMALFVLAWFFLLMRGHWAAPLALVASALGKYATAPLILVDALHCARADAIGWRGYLLRLVPAGLVTAGLFALFYRGPQFFEGIRVIGTWHFLQPRDALSGFGETAAPFVAPLATLITAFFPALAWYRLMVAYRRPEPEEMARAAIAVIAAVLFVLVSHLWPWYLVWGLALAAIEPRWWLSRFIAGVAIFAPFTGAIWWIDPFPNHEAVTALALYVGAALWALATRGVPERAAAAAPDAASVPQVAADGLAIAAPAEPRRARRR